ncbi:hypothetical protein WICMUC_002729 [Wickerhamomyces mucosus]|uniref:Vacuolar protein sorting-associated protein IST1 n=1 Tax=Wickerhamomyces mucosus TaxID=1378264 RepID=A0A9P8TEB1_9ASCO|nr:hypothetical protein WICMUC_002729 [Wickerhamomyces mucosus]
MAISKLRFTQTKRTALAKQQRRLMAELLSLGKEESARIRVENIIREDIYIELLEILELYCELLSARIQLLDQKTCDESLEEAVKVLIYSASHTDLKELIIIKEILVHKFGNEFALSAINNYDGVIPDKIIKRVKYEAPSNDLISLYLEEIAKAYNIAWSNGGSGERNLQELSLSDEDEEDDDESGKPIFVEEESAKDLNSTPIKSPLGNPLVANNRSPITVKPPSKTTDNLHPTVKIPEDVKKNVAKIKKTEKIEKKDDFDSLKKRFEALKR